MVDMYNIIYLYIYVIGNGDNPDLNIAIGI